MDVFISWAKEPSRAVAEALRDWLPDVIQSVKPWMSSADIGAGARWSTDLAGRLASAKIGILCVTPDNQREPWLLFEAGALAKTLEDAYVCPYLIQMELADLAQGPLTQFQAKVADRNGTFALLSMINTALGSSAIPPDRLRRLFERNWTALEAKLTALPTPSVTVQRPQHELLAEILDTVRSLARRLPPPAQVRYREEQALRHRPGDRDGVRMRIIAALQGMLRPGVLETIAPRLGEMPQEELETIWWAIEDGPIEREATTAARRAIALLERLIGLLHECRALRPQLERTGLDPDPASATTGGLDYVALVGALEAGLVRTAEEALTVLRPAIAQIGPMGAAWLAQQERRLDEA